MTPDAKDSHKIFQLGSTCCSFKARDWATYNRNHSWVCDYRYKPIILEFGRPTLEFEICLYCSVSVASEPDNDKASFGLVSKSGSCTNGSELKTPFSGD